MYPSIDGERLKGLIGTVNIIDIRDQGLYNMGNIPTSVNISYNDLLYNTDRLLDKNKKYYIYCSFGFTSAKLCRYLNSLGYDVVNVVGGYNNYLNK